MTLSVLLYHPYLSPSYPRFIPYNPKGLFAVPFLGVLPGLDDIAAFAPPWLLASPRGFLLVPARAPDAPVTSLTEFPYSRTASPQPRDVFVMLAPAPFPAPATPLPAAVTMAPAKFPTPAAAAPVVRAIQPCCCGGMFTSDVDVVMVL